MPAKPNSSHDKPEGVACSRKARGGLAVLCAALLGAALLALSGTAYAGEWVQVSCINPNQTAAGSQGWSSFASGGGYGSTNSTSCGSSGPAYAILSSDAAAAVGSNETLQYTPPAGSTLTGGQLDIAMDADGHGYNASGRAVAYTPEYAYDGSNAFFQCAAGLQPCAGFTNDFTGLLEIPSGRGGNLYLEAGCGGESFPSLRSCDEGASNGAWSLIDLWWANLRLANDATPAASGISGTLLDPDARGARELTLTATDPAGPGVYNITVQVDGQTLYAATPDSNDGQCTAVGISAGALMFDGGQPCKQSENVDIPVETAEVHDGQHTLKVTVTDAAGNSSVVYDNTISTQNAPLDTGTPTINTPAQLTPGSILTAQPGQWSAPAGAGATSYGYQWQACDGEGENCQDIPGAEGSGYTATPDDVGHTLRALVNAADSDGSTSTASPLSSIVNSPPPASTSPSGAATPAGGAAAALTATPLPAPNGAGASEHAQLHLTVQSSITRPYATRALTITGQLLNSAGTPVTDASLEVREQIQAASALQVIGHASTTAEGSFTVHVAAGPSRLILIDYRAYSTEVGHSAQAAIHETVGAGAQMHITPRRTSPTGRIVLAGQVSAPIPAQGVVVELLVHYRGTWEPLRTPRTNSSGHFQVAYQFQGALGRFPFRAKVFGGQAGFPYGTGESAPLLVTTN
jgi:hypothetical protein